MTTSFTSSSVSATLNVTVLPSAATAGFTALPATAAAARPRVVRRPSQESEISCMVAWPHAVARGVTWHRPGRGCTNETASDAMNTAILRSQSRFEGCAVPWYSTGGVLGGVTRRAEATRTSQAKKVRRGNARAQYYSKCTHRTYHRVTLKPTQALNARPPYCKQKERTGTGGCLRHITHAGRRRRLVIYAPPACDEGPGAPEGSPTGAGVRARSTSCASSADDKR